MCFFFRGKTLLPIINCSKRGKTLAEVYSRRRRRPSPPMPPMTPCALPSEAFPMVDVHPMPQLLSFVPPPSNPDPPYPASTQSPWRRLPQSVSTLPIVSSPPQIETRAAQTNPLKPPAPPPRIKLFDPSRCPSSTPSHWSLPGFKKASPPAHGLLLRPDLLRLCLEETGFPPGESEGLNTKLKDLCDPLAKTDHEGVEACSKEKHKGLRVPFTITDGIQTSCTPLGMPELKDNWDEEVPKETEEQVGVVAHLVA